MGETRHHGAVQPHTVHLHLRQTEREGVEGEVETPVNKESTSHIAFFIQSITPILFFSAMGPDHSMTP